jgi:hypothetical protein
MVEVIDPASTASWYNYIASAPTEKKTLNITMSLIVKPRNGPGNLTCLPSRCLVTAVYFSHPATVSIKEWITVYIHTQLADYPSPQLLRFGVMSDINLQRRKTLDLRIIVACDSQN